LSIAVLLALAVAVPPAARPGGPAEAERLAAASSADADPAAALATARRALAMTAEFVPTDFVATGRKGEVVEDEFQAAREAYRRHRASLYEAVGAALSRQGQPVPAARYQRRAFLLDASPARGLALARSLNAQGRGREALDVVQRAISGLVRLEPEAAEVIAQAADAAGLPSAQVEIDRGRLQATLGKAVELREGPLELPPGVRLSTAPAFRLGDAPITAVYAAEASCRHCSADLDALARHAGDARVLALPPGDDQDQALRQVLALYKRPWPLVLGPGLAQRLGLAPRSLLLVARGGWTLAVVKAPFGAEVAQAVAALQREDVRETPPRAGWNRRPVDRSPLAPPPALLAEGLAPGEDEPFPPEFTAAFEAFRAGRAAEARKAFDGLEARGDGWLLPPEARINRALCLAKTGQRDAARRILLRTGDTRFDGDIDRLLEAVAGGTSTSR
jgi:hypothetical protein